MEEVASGMGSWAPWDYIISYVGIAFLAMLFMYLAHRRSMDKLTDVYERGMSDQKQLVAALQSLVVILEAIVAKERER